VLARVLALLFAVIMMMTAVAAHVCASPDVSSEVDDPPDLDSPILPAPVAVPRPDRREPVRIEAPRAFARGRLHAVVVFRPPRLVASR
jgi:hypothetical protein